MKIVNVKIDIAIRKKQQEIANLEAQLVELNLRIRDAKSYIQGVEACLEQCSEGEDYVVVNEGELNK